MNFKGFDNNRVTLLTGVARQKGQLFLPIAVEKLVQRYRFQKVPTMEQMLANTFVFTHGLFEDVGISEVGIYSNGIVASAPTSTETLEQLIHDILAWADTEFELKEVGVIPREWHYESSIVVGMNLNSDKAMPFLREVASSLSQYQESYGLRKFSFDFGGISSAVDTTKYPGRSPAVFSLARRVSVPFKSNIFYSTAPLKTADHFQLLEKIEKLIG